MSTIRSLVGDPMNFSPAHSACRQRSQLRETAEDPASTAWAGPLDRREGASGRDRGGGGDERRVRGIAERSLLRPAPLKVARDKHAAGQIDDLGLKAIEDEEIRTSIRKQEEVGLRAVTDGEFRRAFWHYDFLAGLDGIEFVNRDAETGKRFVFLTNNFDLPALTIANIYKCR